MFIYIFFIIYVQLKCLNFKNLYKNIQKHDNSIQMALDKLNSINNKIYDNPINPSHVDLYDSVDHWDVIDNIGSIINCDEDSQDFSFRKLNFIINNVYDGANILKNNPMLKYTLKIIIDDENNNIDCRVNAAKLLSRLYDIPVSIQTFNPEKERDSKTRDTIVVVPRIQRIFRPDEYIENYKAGNWNV